MKLSNRTFSGITAITLGYLATSLFCPSAASAATDTISCSDVTFIGARGTGEPKGNTQTSLFGASAGLAASKLEAEMKSLDPIITVDYKGIDYEARGATATNFGTFISSGDFNASVKGGVNETVNVMQKVITDCPKTQVVMMGYSQGAEVMHEAANTYFEMHPEHAANLAKVWLISDPSAYHIGTFDQPDGAVYFTEKGEDLNPANKGLIAMMALNQWSPTDVGGPFSPNVKDKVFELCHTNDNICNTPNAVPFSWSEAAEIAAQLSLAPTSLNTTHGEIYKDPTNTIHLDSVKLGAVQISNKVASERPPVVIPDTTPRMVTKWDTSAPGCYAITLPISGTINASVDWGDGAFTPISGSNPFHTYGAPTTTPSIKTITIAGTFTAWGNENSPSAKCIIEVSRWDETGTTNLGSAFKGAVALTKVSGIPSGVTNMLSMFEGATSFNQPIGNWDVSKVTNFGSMFRGATSFNQPIGDWNVSNADMFPGMFSEATSFNQPIGKWNTAKARVMAGMFDGATSFNQPIGDWNIARTFTMGSMFRNASSFNQDLRKWALTGTIEQLRSNMFLNCPIITAYLR